MLSINRYELYECPLCGFIKKKNVLSSCLEKTRYDQHICDDGYIKYMNEVYAKIKNHLIDGLSLDYGCGQIHALSDILVADNRVCDYYDLYYYNSLKPNIYNNIILIEVLEHIKEPFDELVKLKAMLDKNGRIIVMTGFVPNDFANWWYLRDSTHISFFKESSIKQLAYMLDMDLELISEDNIFILKNK